MTAVPGDPRSSTRERVLDAAEACLQRDGIRRTSVLQVATEAGVSRAWVYRLFPDKSTLLSAALIRRDEAFWVEAQHQLDEAEGFAAKVAAAVTLSRAAPLGPLATDLRDREPGPFAEVIGTYVDDIIPGMAWFWRHQLEQGVVAGELRADLDLEAASEWVMRLVVSLVSVPGIAVDIDNRASIERALTTFLMPALAR